MMKWNLFLLISIGIPILQLDGFPYLSSIEAAAARSYQQKTFASSLILLKAQQQPQGYGNSDDFILYTVDHTDSQQFDLLTKENQEEFFPSENISLRPNHTFVEIEYDYLSSDSLNTIKAHPYVKRKKGKGYLLRWWQAVKKWGLLSEELIALEERVRSSLEGRQSTNAEEETNDTTTDSIKNDTDPMNVNTSSIEEEFLSKMLQELLDLSKEHTARLIVIGDIHGCIEEFCELLRKVNYFPGDQVVLLGDLVAKGPYSSEVVRLAMDISALAVRGNHDQETLRQATLFIKGDRSIKVVTKHLKIAKHLSTDQIRWLATLPYYIRSKDLGVLFVHAGMEDGVNLQNQLPSVMLTMRSLIKASKEGKKPSSVCYLAHPWAPSWKGPLKIYFGHDSARGLQRYTAAVGIDTGCVYGGNLTAVLLPNEDTVTVTAKKAYLSHPKKVKLSYKEDDPNK